MLYWALDLDRLFGIIYAIQSVYEIWNLEWQECLIGQIHKEEPQKN
jgi:hypothetical protein